eukprot:3160883-Rhodomonas_salina.1
MVPEDFCSQEGSGLVKREKELAQGGGDGGVSGADLKPQFTVATAGRAASEIPGPDKFSRSMPPRMTGLMVSRGSGMRKMSDL